MAEKSYDNLSSLKLGFIGGGNMASAIGAGLIKKGVLNAENIWVSGKTTRTFGFWNELGAHTTLKNGEVLHKSDVIVLAMKPDKLDEAISDIVKTLQPVANNTPTQSKLFISLLVGVTTDVVESKLQCIAKGPRVVKAMPSTPIMVGEGITVYCLKEPNVEVERLVNTLFSHIGICECIPEKLMNAIGALSASAPAYAYLMTEALADGAVKMGVPREMATKFAAQVLVGAGKMVLETGRHPGQLKDEVCSAGGTTITGIHALEKGGVRGSLMNAVEAAVNKSNELSSLLK